MSHITHWIDGVLSTQKADHHGDIYNPATGQITGTVDFANTGTVGHAVQVATEAFTQWRHSMWQ